ncbi:vWA domain-containing protein [Siansivirga zeaxanthinifaciens]|uniref:Membrane protein n=1 Tax=Siansivirga zeaxanthinifaciens CC-SAMT-1 TaxID=1454006 RepID=A0A0C5WA39_9FLAO|nr:BatA and WFA domain-containing protein [Siansivirga zeaxanthinifaciens]AJR04003.1 membrane protein [Siansivirga zeaxanthinifaciens CC-SAMT-1]
MQFKHPELLYALFLLLIPIIVHLFQLRKFKKVAFTNVAFLKRISLQTRKSSQIKKWLILVTRLLLFTAIIFAFTQPFFSNYKAINLEKETVIYLDNSFSMQAQGDKGPLLKRAVQDLINNIPEAENVSIVTNDQSFRNTSIKAIKNELLQLNYTSNTLNLDAAVLKSKSFFTKNKKSVKNLVLISDFQQDKNLSSLTKDSLVNINVVRLKPVNTNNISIDSAYIATTTATSVVLNVILKNSGNQIKNLPISVFNKSQLIAKTSVDLLEKTETSFTLPINEEINGQITIDDNHLLFDNSLYFSINKPSKINVLSINEGDDGFLKRIYTDNEFNYLSTKPSELNYNVINDQNLIILNELNDIPNALANTLKAFIAEGGYVLVIPSNKTNTNYNSFLLNYGIAFNDLIASEKLITTINYAHPLYQNGVFEKQVTNFQYPKTNSFYKIASKSGSSILSYEDGAAFLLQDKNIFVFTSALNSDNSNFKNSPLIVPTLYNMGAFSLKTPRLYYQIGKQNSFDVATSLQQDAVVSLKNETLNIIPKQQYFNNKVRITTFETPSVASSYWITNKNQNLKLVSYNYNRDESNLNYIDPSTLENVNQSNSITELFDKIKSDTEINALWKWFVIFAFILLIIEMLILKYFK